MKSPKKSSKTATKSSAMPRSMVMDSDMAPVAPPAAGVPTQNSIVSPAAGARVNVGNPARVPVVVYLIAGYDAAKAGCFPIGGAVDIADPGVVDLAPLGAADVPGYHQGSVAPAVVGVDNPALANNNQCAAWAHEVATDAWVAIDPVEFKAYALSSVTVQVDAKRCMWFAWADNVANQNGVPEAGDEYRPVEIAIPEGVASVTVAADDVPWFSGMSFSTSEGKTDDPAGCENPLYRHADLNSANIDLYGGAIARYSLVAMLGGEDYDAGAAYSIRPAGHTPGSVNYPEIPVDANLNKKLFLAFHEGADWTNNAGVITVTVTFNAANV